MRYTPHNVDEPAPCGIVYVSNAARYACVLLGPSVTMLKGGVPSTRVPRAPPQRLVWFTRSKAVYVTTLEPGSFVELV